MSLSFSQRVGKKPVELPFQREGINASLRTRLWNLYDVFLFRPNYFFEAERSLFANGFILTWAQFFNRTVDSIPYKYDNAVLEIKDFFFRCEWYELYDYIEFSLENYDKLPRDFSDYINEVLEVENATYRLINRIISPVISENEIQEISKALDTPISGVMDHLSTALTLMSKRENPDYRNSIKESISAVESLAKSITSDDKATLGKALSKIKDSKNIHPAFEKALTALYGYTSDESGIRHALLDESRLEEVDARFMLVVCSAFVNYLNAIEK